MEHPVCLLCQTQRVHALRWKGSSLVVAAWFRVNFAFSETHEQNVCLSQVSQSPEGISLPVNDGQSIKAVD